MSNPSKCVNISTQIVFKIGMKWMVEKIVSIACPYKYWNNTGNWQNINPDNFGNNNPKYINNVIIISLACLPWTSSPLVECNFSWFMNKKCKGLTKNPSIMISPSEVCATAEQA